ncbi:hypothetical protein IFM89_021469 [Coptis chinensis]|uniref:Uncharacterized protein n=1 Tax=Coptis chinensis TaxID=261450 RepID=A0A835M6V5_9MAGN|nr:hypothetical protein IFM89_021469 [Coptis chinensis]
MLNLGSPSIYIILFSLLLLSYFPVENIQVHATTPLPKNVKVPAIFAFGDSIVDPGNNNHLPTLARSNFPPYGKDFMGGRPTGRFSNGKIPTDLLVDALGIKKFLPAYNDPTLKPEDLLTGVSFASGGSGLDPFTAQLLGLKLGIEDVVALET